ncbi:MAG: NGG1p interacting factor NIF3 [Candidatus Omnitrophota bacterium]
MKLGHFYQKAIEFGKELDPRGKSRVSSFEDTAVLFGSPDAEVKKIMVGIDIDGSELLVADRLRKERGLDLVISHHPQGRASAAFYKVMRLQVEMLEAVGVSRGVAEELLKERMSEVERRVISANHMRTVDIARLLNIPFMCLHTPADNHVSHFLNKLLKKEDPKRLSDIVEILSQIPEYKEAARDNAGPRIICGNPNRPVGKIFVEMTGGTEGHREVYGKLYKLGVRTLVSMHLSEEHFKKVRDADLNVVIAGHISSDTLGLNILLDRLENGIRMEVFNCAGFRRVRRGRLKR